LSYISTALQRKPNYVVFLVIDISFTDCYVRNKQQTNVALWWRTNTAVRRKLLCLHPGI